MDASNHDELEIFINTIKTLSNKRDMNESFIYTIAALTVIMEADVGIIWIISDDKLVAVSQYGLKDDNRFYDAEIPASETARILIELESSSGTKNWTTGYANINNEKLEKMSPSWHQINLSIGAKSKMIARLGLGSRAYGLVEILHLHTERHWSQIDGALFKSMCDLITAILERGYEESRTKGFA